MPLTLLKHHLNRFPVPDWVPVPSGASGTCAQRSVGYLCPAERRVHQQVYLHPYPKELMLRNHV
jgi:uncharacterized protein YbgA (DUF1722 family)